MLNHACTRKHHIAAVGPTRPGVPVIGQLAIAYPTASTRAPNPQQPTQRPNLIHQSLDKPDPNDPLGKLTSAEFELIYTAADAA